MAELPTGTVTFLFTDIEGSTALLKAVRDDYAKVLSDHQELLRSAFEEGGGREIDTQGDAFFVVFSRAKDAVFAAASAQRSLAGHAWPQGSTVRVRMGIHTGEPVLGGDRYVGLGVHRAARICAAAHGGQVLLSNATRELIEDDLPVDLALADLGEQKLKDIDRPERIFQLVIPQLPDRFPPLRTPAEPAFRGREGELTTAAEAVVRSKLGLSGRSRRLLAPIALLLAAGIVAAVLALTGLIGGEAGSIVPSQSLGVIDPAVNKVVATVDLPNPATGMAVGAGAVWAADRIDETILRIDPNSRRVDKSIGVGLAPQAIAAGNGMVWVAVAPPASAGDNYAQVREVDPSTNQPSSRIITIRNVGPRITGLATDSAGVWLAASRVIRIRASDGSVEARVHGIVDASSLATGDNSVWVAEGFDHLVTLVDSSTNAVEYSIPFGAQDPESIALGAGAVWVADTAKNQVWRIDPVQKTVQDTIPVGRGPAGIAVGEGAVWVANRFDGTVSRIDPTLGKVVATIRVGKSVDRIGVGEGAVWVSVP